MAIPLRTYGILPPEAATVCCGRRTQGFMRYLSWLNPGQMTPKSLCPSATSNCGGLRPWIGFPVIQKCCALWPQQTVAASGGKIPYVFQEMVTQHFPVKVPIGPSSGSASLIKERSNIISLTNRGGGGGGVVISESGNWVIWIKVSYIKFMY